SLLQRSHISPRDCRIELYDINQRAGNIQFEHSRVGRSKPARLWPKRMAQIGQIAAQIIESLPRAAVWPEHRGKPVAIGLPITTQSEQRQQPLSLAGTQTCQRLTMHSHGKCPKQLYLKRYGVLAVLPVQSE